MIPKAGQKTHLRSLTQHKIENTGASNQEQFSLNLQQRNGGRRQPSASGKSAKNVQQSNASQPSSKADASGNTFEHKGNNPQHNTYGQNGNPATQDAAATHGDNQQFEGKFLPNQPSSKPNSSKNKKLDSRDDRGSSQNKHSKPSNQSATDTIDANTPSNPKVNVKSSLTGKQFNNGQNVRASISKEVNTSQNQHTV